MFLVLLEARDVQREGRRAQRLGQRLLAAHRKRKVARLTRQTANNDKRLRYVGAATLRVRTMPFLEMIAPPRRRLLPSPTSRDLR